MEELQQYSRRNSIRIDGIPEPDDGTKELVDTLETKVNELFSESMKIKLHPSDFCRMYRVGKPRANGQPKQIILKFTNYGAKRRIMKARSTLKDHKGDYPIFINDDLTRQRAQLARQAREAKRDQKIKDTWVYDGKVFIKLQSDQVKVVTTDGGFNEAISE